MNPNDNSVEGTIEILATSSGNRVMNMIKNDPKKFEELFVIRPRGTGIVNERGEVENYTLYSFDVISRDKDAFDPKKISGEEVFKIE